MRLSGDSSSKEMIPTAQRSIGRLSDLLCGSLDLLNPTPQQPTQVPSISVLLVMRDDRRLADWLLDLVKTKPLVKHVHGGNFKDAVAS